MPVYNCAPFVKQAVESILQQTYSHFELLVIDDCSTDNTAAIVQNIKDERIVFIKKEKNTRYTNSLNMGLNLAKGQYIARMDGDDYSLPQRFERQMAAMEADKAIALCGTWYRIMDSEKVVAYPTESDAIKIALLSYSPIGHPTAFLRKSSLQKLGLSYDSAFEPAEDYRLWTQLAARHTIVNIPEILLNYRVHSTQVSQQKMELQQAHSNKIRLMQLQHLKISPTNGQEELHIALVTNNIAASRSFSNAQVQEWLMLLHQSNQLEKIYEPGGLSVLLMEYWHRSVFSRFEYNPATLKMDWGSPFGLYKKLGRAGYLKFMIKCIFKNNKVAHQTH